jgi:hypothetical protein
VAEPTEDPMDGGAEGDTEGQGSLQAPGPLRGREVITDFLASTDVGWRILDTAEEEAQTEKSEWGPRERGEREEERRLEAGELGAEAGERWAGAGLVYIAMI